MSPQLKAFLDTLAVSEIGKPLLAVSDNGYNVLVGATAKKPLLFASYADHPNVYNAACDSTAAGRYQQLYRYWPAYKRQLKLADFGPRSQDTLAIQLIRECRALDDIEAGRVADALRKCKSRWASLPGAGYGQHENKVEALVAAFTEAGGVLA